MTLATAVALAMTGCGAAHDLAATDGGTERDRSGRAAEPVSFTVAATGDFLLHQALLDQGAADAGNGPGGRLGLRTARRDYDFRPMLAQLKPVISRADLGICHIETPVGSPGGRYVGYPSFNSPPQIVDAVAGLGYDTCSTSSNHSLDRGAAGVESTLRALDRAGIKHAGSARSAQEAGRTNVVNVKGIKVAQLSYTYGTNDIPKPKDKPWLVNSELNPQTILSDARRARAGGADVVIASMHWGQEYQHEPTAEQKALARRLLSAPEVDLIIGHHAHVVQPIDKINGKWVAYGVGNQVANPTANSPSTHRGIVAQFRFSRRPDGQWQVDPSFVPTLVTGPPVRLNNLAAARSTQTASLGGGPHQQALRDTAKIVRGLGRNVPIGGDQATSPSDTAGSSSSNCRQRGAVGGPDAKDCAGRP